MSDQIATLTVMRSEVERLPALLENLSAFGERHMVETGDAFDAIRQQAGVIAHHAPLPWGAAFDAARNAAVPHIRAPWVLIVDTDERVPPSLRDYLVANLETWQRAGVEGVYLPRKNHVLGRPLWHSSSWPDYQLRLMRREKVNFGAQLHRFGPRLEKTLHAPAEERVALLHYSFESTADYVRKINLYSSIEAEQSTERGGVPRALLAATRDFASRFVRQQGFRDGAAGLHFAMCMAFYRYLSVVKREEPKKP